MPWVTSDLLAVARYDSAAGHLRLRFNKGTVYHYLEVPQEVYEELLSPPSAGAYFVHSIRDNYSFIVAHESKQEGSG